MLRPFGQGWFAPFAALGMACGQGYSGDRAWEARDLPEAIRRYQAASDLSTERRMRLARALAGTGALEAAEAQLQALPQAAWTPDGWMAQGLVLLGAERPAEAAVAFATGAELGGDPALRVNHCGALLAAETPDAAVCAQALVAAPQDPAALLGLAVASLAEDNPTVVERSLAQLAGAPGVLPDQLVQAGRIQQRLGDAAAACRSFTQAQAGLEGGLACAAAGLSREAVALLEPLAASEPGAAFALGALALDRALAANDPGERERASADAWRRLRACEAAYARDPGWHNNAGRLHALDGAEQAAEVSFRRALELDAQAPYPALNLARLLAARGERAESGRLLERVAALGGLTGAIAGLDLARRAAGEGDRSLAVERARAVLAGCQGEQTEACVVESCIELATLLAEPEPELAIALLERAWEIGGTAVADRLRAEPELRRLEADERFARMVGGAP